jgi:hypothetical protein
MGYVYETVLLFVLTCQYYHSRTIPSIYPLYSQLPEKGAQALLSFSSLTFFLQSKPFEAKTTKSQNNDSDLCPWPLFQGSNAIMVASYL